MPIKKKSSAWYDLAAENFGFKYDKISAKGNIVCKKLSAKSLKAIKAAGIKVGRIPNGSYVIYNKYVAVTK